MVINQNIEKGNIANYLEFLKIGGSKPTLETLSIAGVDLTKKEVFQNAFTYLKQLLDEYEVLIEK